MDAAGAACTPGAIIAPGVGIGGVGIGGRGMPGMGGCMPGIPDMGGWPGMGCMPGMVGWPGIMPGKPGGCMPGGCMPGCWNCC